MFALPYLLAAIGVLLVAVLALMYRLGRAHESVSQAKAQAAQAVKVTQEVQADVAKTAEAVESLSVDDLRARLRAQRDDHA